VLAVCLCDFTLAWPHKQATLENVTPVFWAERPNYSTTDIHKRPQYQVDGWLTFVGAVSDGCDPESRRRPGHDPRGCQPKLYANNWHHEVHSDRVFPIFIADEFLK
jgi:hypothetical protein